jgi:hypothetical protein
LIIAKHERARQTDESTKIKVFTEKHKFSLKPGRLVVLFYPAICEKQSRSFFKAHFRELKFNGCKDYSTCFPELAQECDLTSLDDPIKRRW